MVVERHCHFGRRRQRLSVGACPLELAGTRGIISDEVQHTVPWRSTDATITPGIGGRLLLAPDMAFRVDLRDAIVLRGGTRHNVEVVGGMSVVL